VSAKLSSLSRCSFASLALPAKGHGSDSLPEHAACQHLWCAASLVGSHLTSYLSAVLQAETSRIHTFLAAWFAVACRPWWPSCLFGHHLQCSCLDGHARTCNTMLAFPAPVHIARCRNCKMQWHGKAASVARHMAASAGREGGVFPSRHLRQARLPVWEGMTAGVDRQGKMAFAAQSLHMYLAGPLRSTFYYRYHMDTEKGDAHMYAGPLCGHTEAALRLQAPRRYFQPFPSALTPRVVTLWYRAPEILLGAEVRSSGRAVLAYAARRAP